MDLEANARALLLKNRRRRGEHQYTVPSPGTYPYQWLWDSCFHAIALSHFDPEAAKEEIRSLFAAQLPNGMVPHMIFWEKHLLLPYFLIWHNQSTSSITQPPMLAYALWEMHRKHPDMAFLKEVYAPLMRFYRYIIEKRDPWKNHLASIINPDESGEDNSPRFDTLMGVKSGVSFLRHMYERWRLVEANHHDHFNEANCMRQNFWVNDVPFNVILLCNLQALGRIASLMEDAEGERFAADNETLIRRAMREHMFEDGVFWSVDGKDNRKFKVATWAHFVPLFANLYTKKEADEVMERHFRNEKTFRSPYGIRSVSREEPSYGSNKFWRGPIWLAPQWFIYKGLRSYGYTEDADFIRDTFSKCVHQSSFREFFNPETGEGRGARNFTWGTLALDMND